MKTNFVQRYNQLPFNEQDANFIKQSQHFFSKQKQRIPIKFVVKFNKRNVLKNNFYSQIYWIIMFRISRRTFNKKKKKKILHSQSYYSKSKEA